MASDVARKQMPGQPVGPAARRSPDPRRGSLDRLHGRGSLRQARRILPIVFAETSGGLSEDYTTEMQEKMGGSLTYEHDRGMNYTRILDGTRSHPGLIVGSCLQTPEDAERLRNDEKVRAVLCLQQDKDMAYFDLDILPVLGGCEAVGIDHFRSRVNDFDPHDLRLRLPDAVAALERAARLCGPGESVYVHCTAGLGRAPGVAIAYMYWVLGYGLMEAHGILTSKRPCHPKLESIRLATCDMLLGSATTKVKIGIRAPVSAREVLVAGLDMGWDRTVSCVKENDRFVLERDLPGGRFQYKYIVDGRWTYNADAPTLCDNGNNNNYLDVVTGDDHERGVRSRVLSTEAELLLEEREIILRSIVEAYL